MVVAAIIVIYNCRCTNCDALVSLQSQLLSDHILVFDNGPYFEYNKRVCALNKWQYLTFNKNVGLSKAYNYSIEYIYNKLPDTEIILISDDDTCYPKYFINDMIHLFKMNPSADIILPKIISKGRIVSPSYIDSFGRVHRQKYCKNWKISAFNSGSVMRLNVFDHIKYDERLFLDCVDRDFYLRAVALNFQIVQDNSIEVSHSFSGFETSLAESKLHRFHITCHDMLVFSSIRLRYSIYFRISLLYQAIALGCKYHTIKFLQLYINALMDVRLYYN